MSHSLRILLQLMLLLFWLPLAGCSSGPAAVEHIRVDADDASAEALRLYDKDGDGRLDEQELAEVPALRQHLDKYDQDQDGTVSGDEIAARIREWREQGVGLRTLNVKVIWEGRPLEGATVRFVPEPYLGDDPKVATGTTDGQGIAKVSVAPEHLPEELRTARLRGIFGGSYRVEVEHPRIELPADYRNGRALGYEIARDTVGDRIILELTKS